MEHKQCKKIFERETKLQGRGCVPEGSIPFVERECSRCAFSYQCETGWCHPKHKLCVKAGSPCLSGIGAGCSNCPSERGVDFRQCNCTKHPEFPNKWVKCINGSSVFDKYPLKPGYMYERNEYNDRLKSSDLFAKYAQCYHNRYREMIGLAPLSWNNKLATYAKNWLQNLKETQQCRISHSSGANRTGIGGFWMIGENLFRKAVIGEVTMNQIPRFAMSSVTAWYGEMIYYQYAGPNAGSGACPYRNNDLSDVKTIYHMTQVLWNETTHVACDYAICGPTESDTSYVAVSCVYGPTGNIQGKAAFNETTYNKLKDNPETLEKFGNVTRCEIEPDEPATTTPAATVAEQQDGTCVIKKKSGDVRHCDFPWTKPGWRVFNSCQEAVDRRGKPHCWSREQTWELCPENSTDPDCYFEMPVAEEEIV